VAVDEGERQHPPTPGRNNFCGFYTSTGFPNSRPSKDVGKTGLYPIGWQHCQIGLPEQKAYMAGRQTQTGEMILNSGEITFALSDVKPGNYAMQGDYQ
jgi:hypothetical protein